MWKSDREMEEEIRDCDLGLEKEIERSGPVPWDITGSQGLVQCQSGMVLKSSPYRDYIITPMVTHSII